MELVGWWKWKPSLRRKSLPQHFSLPMCNTPAPLALQVTHHRCKFVKGPGGNYTQELLVSGFLDECESAERLKRFSVHLNMKNLKSSSSSNIALHFQAV